MDNMDNVMGNALVVPVVVVYLFILLVWGAKESLYKIFGKKQLRFLENIYKIYEKYQKMNGFHEKNVFSTANMYIHFLLIAEIFATF